MAYLAASVSAISADIWAFKRFTPTYKILPSWLRAIHSSPVPTSLIIVVSEFTLIHPVEEAPISNETPYPFGG